MKNPNDEKHLKVGSENDMFDSDITMITEVQKVKPEAPYSQMAITNTSQSMLKINVKKTSDMTSKGSTSKNNKTRNEVKEKVSGEFLSQDIFQQSCSDKFVNLTPKKVKESDASDIISPKKQHEEEVLNSSRKNKKKKNKGHNSSVISENGDYFNNRISNTTNDRSSSETTDTTGVGNDVIKIKKKKHDKSFSQIVSSNGEGNNSQTVSSDVFHSEGIVGDSSKGGDESFLPHDKVKEKEKKQNGKKNNLLNLLKKYMDNYSSDIDCSNETMYGFDSQSMLKTNAKRNSDMSSRELTSKSDKNPNEVKGKVSIDFLSQDILQQTCSDQFVNLTPKKVKEGDASDIISPKKELEEEILNSSRKNKKKKNKGHNSSVTSENGDYFNNSFQDSSTIYSQLHTSLDLNVDSKEFNDISKSEIKSECCKNNKKKKKSKNIESDAINNSDINKLNQKQEIDCQFCGTGGIYAKNDSSRNKINYITNDRNSSETTDNSSVGNDIIKTKKKKRKHDKSFSQIVGSNGEGNNSQTVSSEVFHSEGIVGGSSKGSDESFLPHDNKINAKKKKQNGKKNGLLNLLDKYLDNYSSDIDCSNKTTCGFDSQSLIKNKKKKNNSIAGESISECDEPPAKKKKKNSIDFLTQDIFKQPSSESFTNSTPKKMKKKKDKEISETSLNGHKSLKYEGGNYSSDDFCNRGDHIKNDGRSVYESDESEIKSAPGEQKKKKKKHKYLEETNDSKENVLDQSYGEKSLLTSDNESILSTIDSKISIDECDLSEYSMFLESDKIKEKKKSKTPSDKSFFDSTSQSSVKSKKKKNTSIVGESISECDEPGTTKKKKKSIDFFTQDIFKQPSSESFGYSTPEKIKREDRVLNASETNLNGHKSLKHENSNSSTENSCDSVKNYGKSIYESDESEIKLEPSEHKKKKKKPKYLEETNDSKENVLGQSNREKNLETSDDESFLISTQYSKQSIDESDFSEDSMFLESDKIEKKKKSKIPRDKSFLDSTGKMNSSSENSSELSNGNDAYFGSDDSDDNEKDKLEVLKLNLKNLNFEIDFLIPDLHEICHRASKPTPEQRMILSAKKIPVKTGKFSKAEDEQIKANWEQFVKIHNVENIPEVFFCLNRKYITIKEKQKFLYFLAQNLPERTPYSVFQRFKLLLGSTKMGRFTEEEDKFIKRHMKETGCRRNYMTEIAQRLQRPFHSIEKRIQVIREKSTRKIRWKKANIAVFIKYLLKVTHTDPDDLEKLKNRHISSQEWIKLSKKLDGVSVKVLKRVWLVKIHPVLFVPDDIYDLRKVKLKLIKMFNENNETDWRSVNWSNYASLFEGLTYLRIYTMMKTLVISKVPSDERSNLKKCLKILNTFTENDLQKHVIYKIRYENKQVFQLAAKV